MRASAIELVARGCEVVAGGREFRAWLREEPIFGVASEVFPRWSSQGSPLISFIVAADRSRSDATLRTSRGAGVLVLYHSWDRLAVDQIANGTHILTGQAVLVFTVARIACYPAIMQVAARRVRRARLDLLQLMQH